MGIEATSEVWDEHTGNGFMPPPRGSGQIDRGGSRSGVFGALRAPATISKACLRIGLRDEQRANWHPRFIAQFAQRVSPAGSSILNSHLLVLCPRCVPPCPHTDQRISSVGAISCLPVIGSEPQQFRQADFNDASRKPLPRAAP